jgi:ferrous iron transport protein A
VVEVLGDARLRRSLEELGFVPGAAVTVLRQVRGDVIVRLAESRLAIGRACAGQIATVAADQATACPGAAQMAPARLARSGL